MEGLAEFRRHEEPMEEGHQWSLPEFIAIQKEIMAGGEAEALSILDRLSLIDPNQVEPSDATLDGINDAVKMALAKVEVSKLLTSHQTVALRLLAPSTPPTITLKLIHRLNADKNRVQEMLGGAALATGVALARKLPVHLLTPEICLLLAPLFTVPAILGEYTHQATESSEGGGARMCVYQALGAALAEGHYDETMEPIIGFLKDDINHRDILLQMSAIDLLSDIVLKCHPPISDRLLETFGPLIYALFQSSMDAPDGGFIYQGAQKCLCELISFSPSSSALFPSLIPSVVQQVTMFSALDASARVRAFDLFSLLGRTGQGKDLLVSTLGEAKIREVMGLYSTAIRAAPVEMKTRHVQSLAFLLKDGPDDTVHHLFSAIGLSFPADSVALAQRPFPELRAAVYEMWMNVVTRDWGAELFLVTPEFVEWLMPYSGTSWLDSQAWKDICEALLRWEAIDKVMSERIKSAILAHNNPRAQVEISTQL